MRPRIGEVVEGVNVGGSSRMQTAAPEREGGLLLSGFWRGLN